MEGANMNKTTLKAYLRDIHRKLDELVESLDEGDYWMNYHEEQERESIEVDNLDFDSDSDYPTRLQFHLICHKCGKNRSEPLTEPCVFCL